MEHTVAVTGATGHIGSMIVRALVAQGRRVIALAYGDERSLSGVDVERRRVDVRDRAAVRAALEGAQVVYHTAAFISLNEDDIPRMREVNVRGTQNVVDACLALGVRRVVHFSSLHALAPCMSGVVTEEDSPFVDTVQGMPGYCRVKAEGERVVRAGIERGLNAIILRPSSVVGPYDHQPSMMGQFVLDLAHARVPALVDGGSNFVDVRDVVDTALAAERRGTAGSAYLLGGEWFHLKDVAAVVERVTGRRPPRAVLPVWVAEASLPVVGVAMRAFGGKYPQTSATLHILTTHRHVNDAKARSELGHVSRPLVQSFTDALRWLLDERANQPGAVRPRTMVREDHVRAAV